MAEAEKKDLMPKGSLSSLCLLAWGRLLYLRTKSFPRKQLSCRNCVPISAAACGYSVGSETDRQEGKRRTTSVTRSNI